LFSGSFNKYPPHWLFSLLLATSAEDIYHCESYGDSYKIVKHSLSG
jgi:hypothetical protein